MIRHIVLIVLLIFVLVSAGVVAACSSDDNNEIFNDRIAIENQIYLYAQCLDWDRADEEAGKELFLSVFTDDCVLGYPAFDFSVIGKGENAPTANESGGLGWFYSDFNMSSQKQSLTLISNIIIDIDGDVATSSDRYSHIGYFKGVEATYSNAVFSWGYHEGKWRKENGQWKCYEWDGNAQFTGTMN